MSAVDAPWREHGLTRTEYERIVALMKREPNYEELALFGVMWSEHCSYKNSRAQLKKFPTTGPQVIQGPGENAGVVSVGDGLGVAFKMESHNHPSAIEPYQGAATGVGGIIRDIFAMGARPIASLNSLRFGLLDNNRTRRLLAGVVAGIAGYGNCMGIPTVAGEVSFHPAYQGNPLVNAMSVGLVAEDKIFKGSATGVGNIVMVVGARTGRDGIKGASFASEELSDADPDKRPNVQVGDPFMEKLLLEATLEILENNLVIGLQDLGAAGLTSSASEMAGRAGNGLYIDIDRVPLREEGLKPWEIMLSESQERMLLVVDPAKVEAIEKIFDKWDLVAAAIGQVTGDGRFTVRRGQEVLASVPAGLLTDEAPVNIRPWSEPAYFAERKKADLSPTRDYPDRLGLLKKLLAWPDICSKRWIYEQYDHMVGLRTVVRPGGGDAAILRLPGGKGLSLSCDCNSRYVYLDPWRGGAIAVAEAARNVACTGAKPLALTNCLNFGNPENPEIYWQFVQATDGLAAAARELDTPVTGGNVSFYNEYNGQPIPPTPTIGLVGLLPDIENRLTIGFQQEGDLVMLIGRTGEELGASAAHFLVTGRDEGPVPAIDLPEARRLNDFLVAAAAGKLLASAHDCAEGGLAVALAESALAGNLGASLDWVTDTSVAAALFGESQSRVVLSLNPAQRKDLEALAAERRLILTLLGVVGGRLLRLTVNGQSLEAPLAELSDLYQNTLARLVQLSTTETESS
ncbi:MAG: phosphoribosylformylglycinamidine synthase subunit PurL [Candidatus Adiutrix sp.]|jgi:phosphoribosylformylglycinamidine synthase|nr:phosphoribosylformylglycinamidine synthase subunit PurL [Candidatus Adiutrix sp.]